MTVKGHYILFVLGLCLILQACAGGPPPKELLALTEAQMKIRDRLLGDKALMEQYLKLMD